MSDLVSSLVSKVKEWQKVFQFDYAELVASPDVESKVAPWYVFNLAHFILFLLK